MNLIILLPPRVDKEENPRECQDDISNNLSRPIMGEILEPPLEVKPPNGDGNMDKYESLRKEALELSVLNKTHHEQDTSDRKKQQPSKGVRGLDHELVVRRRTQKLTRRLRAVAENRDLIEIEHHEGSARDSNRGMKKTDQEEHRQSHRLYKTPSITLRHSKSTIWRKKP
ncbi:hypothetical protein NE237_000272 [Protea cynaroides]|uniref:Uncharacterized protein n=1 Tax=Protea cynaroides TaxID=273540 RepID=A0A9Q0KRQ3_9MAGN|nr:hypothetical protein NE237_000272 [Protea cynaroides]